MKNKSLLIGIIRRITLNSKHFGPDTKITLLRFLVLAVLI